MNAKLTAGAFKTQIIVQPCRFYEGGNDARKSCPSICYCHFPLAVLSLTTMNITPITFYFLCKNPENDRNSEIERNI